MFDKLFIQRGYAEQIGNRLDRYKVQSYAPFRANFRCPICGDSQRNKFKCRGYFLEKNMAIIFHCHNECGAMGFERFLKDYYGDLYAQYKFDVIQEWKHNKKDTVFETASKTPEIEELNVEVNDLGLEKAMNISSSKEYILSRKIPKQFHDDIYYTDKFYGFVNDHIDDKFPENMVEQTDKRIVFPLRDENGDIFGVIGRSIDGNDTKYLTIRFKDNHPKIFGLERLDKSKLSYVLEGPIDSFFVNNSVAFAGTDGNPEAVFKSTKDFVLVLDNQPRSKSVLKKYEKYIAKGYQMVIWPDSISGKDINQLYLEGMSQEAIMNMLQKNTYTGLRLEIMFKQWRKI